jgi:hypothetical protein
MVQLVLLVPRGLMVQLVLLVPRGLMVQLVPLALRGLMVLLVPLALRGLMVQLVLLALRGLMVPQGQRGPKAQTFSHGSMIHHSHRYFQPQVYSSLMEIGTHM